MAACELRRRRVWMEFFLLLVATPVTVALVVEYPSAVFWALHFSGAGMLEAKRQACCWVEDDQDLREAAAAAAPAAPSSVAAVAGAAPTVRGRCRIQRAASELNHFLVAGFSDAVARWR